MSGKKLNRGRPAIDDAASLMEAAKLMVANPGMTKWEAFGFTAPVGTADQHNAHCHRLNRKWKAESAHWKAVLGKKAKLKPFLLNCATASGSFGLKSTQYIWPHMFKELQPSGVFAFHSLFASNVMKQVAKQNQTLITITRLATPNMPVFPDFKIPCLQPIAAIEAIQKISERLQVRPLFS